MEIKETEYNPEDELYFKEKAKTLILKKPSKYIINLYYISKISELLQLRAEYYYSIENKYNTDSYKKLNTFNKNFEILVNLVNSTIKNKAEFPKLLEFINYFIDNNKEKYNPEQLENLSMPADYIYKYKTIYSIKHVRNIQEWLSFFVFQYNI
jgi:hypothetical protein